MFEEFIAHFDTPEDKHIWHQISSVNEYRVLPEEIKNKVVLDIGANIGCFSFFCYLLGANKVISYEMDKFNYDKLKKYMPQDRIFCYNEAVYPYKKNITYSSQGVCSNIYENSGDKTVETISLERIIEKFDLKNNDDLVVKMDCEGTEYENLMTLPTKYLRLFSLIYMEIHDIEEHRNILINYLRNHGFKDELLGQSIMTWANGAVTPVGGPVYKFRRINFKM